MYIRKKGQQLPPIGARFGRLVVIGFAPSRPRPRDESGKYKKPVAYWECQCDCGKIVAIKRKKLRGGNTRSCGCLKTEIIKAGTNTKHGMSRYSEYKSWHGMMVRCYNPGHVSYADYGGRGIQVCDRWHTFENFYEDMGKRPPNTSIDRINNNGDYEPENCRWGTIEEQSNNRRNSVYVEFNGRRRTVGQWEHHFKVNSGFIRGRLYKGMCFLDIVLEILKKKHKDD